MDISRLVELLNLLVKHIKDGGRSVAWLELGCEGM